MLLLLFDLIVQVNNEGIPYGDSFSITNRYCITRTSTMTSRLRYAHQAHRYPVILGDPGAASRDDGIFMGESLQQERESPWVLTLTERVPEAFEIPPSDWPEKYFSGQSAKRNSRATLMSSYTRLFSSSNAVVAWPVQREHFLGELQKK